jgi:hypothetical protein
MGESRLIKPNPSNGGHAIASPPVELELDPPQPPPVTEAVASLLETAEAGPDPWWQAGIDEALEPSPGT